MSGEQFFGGKPGQVVQNAAETMQQPGLGSELKSRISNVTGEMGAQFRGEGEFAGQSNIRKATGVVAKGFSAPFGLAKDILPEPAEKGLI